MTVALALAALATRFAAIDVTGQSDPARVFNGLSEAVNLADFPAVVLHKAKGNTENALVQESMGSPGLTSHRYFVEFFIFVAGAQLPVAAADTLLQPWGQALMVALLADQTLGGAVAYIGDDETGQLCTYVEGLIPWIDNQQYWGLKGLLPVTELISTTVG